MQIQCGSITQVRGMKRIVVNNRIHGRTPLYINPKLKLLKTHRLPKQAPITAPQPLNLPTKTSRFALTNQQPSIPLFPLSNGTDPTPKPIVKNHNDTTFHRTGLIGIKIGMTSLWDEWGIMKPVTVIKVY